jgi:signal transduction histidine kinase
MSARTHVLYIEDDPGSQRLVQRVLERHNYRVHLASEGLAGITLAREVAPQIILMDINLPGMNGREITTRLRDLPNFENVPIVALSANTSPGHRERALAAGCDGYLTKPIDVATFHQQVNAFLLGHRDELHPAEKLHFLESHSRQVVRRLEGKVRELEEANSRLRELDQLKADFITLVSHELRTPLTLLEGYVYLLNEEVGEAARHADLLPMVNGLEVGVRRIGQVINEIINVSRIAGGRLELALGPVSIPMLVNRIADEVADVLAQRQLQLAVGGLADLPLIEADGRQLRVVFSNIMDNAIKYTPDGGWISVEGNVVDGAVHLTFVDSGVGIPPEEQRRIFDQFYVLESLENHSTSKSAFKGGGIGLGLAIARGIVEAHGGRIWVGSPGGDERDEKGSTFHVLLPQRQPEPNHPAAF